MRSLSEVQRAFGAALADPASVDERLPLLDVYRVNVAQNCIKALAGAYPILRKIVGADFFDAMAWSFVRAHPSRSGNLARYGAEMAGFVCGFDPARDLAYLPDVARMEWLAHRAYYAADPAPFNQAGLRGGAQLRPRLAPACALLTSPWPLARIWRTHQDDYRGSLDGVLGGGREHVLVCRPRWRVQVQALALGDWIFLDSSARGRPLGEALVRATLGDADFDASLALARWVDAGVIVTLE